MKTYNDALTDVHHILADFYDEELKRNKINAMRNISTTILKLKKRIDLLLPELEVDYDSLKFTNLEQDSLSQENAK